MPKVPRPRLTLPAGAGRLERPVRRRFPTRANGPASSADSSRRASRAEDRRQRHALILRAEARHGNPHGSYSAGAAAACGLREAMRGAPGFSEHEPERAGPSG
jgi:hypothetical protein